MSVFQGVKLKSFTAFFAAALYTIGFLSGCKEVSEEYSVVTEYSLTSEIESQTAFTETFTETSASDTVSETTVSSEITLQVETSETQTEQMSETTTEEFVAEETTAKETTTTAETTAEVTLQTESPAETAVVTVIRVPVVTEQETAYETTAETSSAETTVISEETTLAETAKPSVYGVNYYSALNYREQKGIWISYLEYDSIMKNKSESSFRNTIAAYFDNVKALDFNTVYVQARAHGDAYYDSELYPSGDRFNGTMGTSESYDALQIMIEEAHARGLSVHAWINPMRLMTDTQIKGLSDSCKISQWYNNSETNGTYIVKHSGRWYFNPAYSEVVEFIADGITEITANYDVDGIQIDDYFYPTTDSSFDSTAYKNSDTAMSLSDWREKNVNYMVKKLYNAVHSANPSAVFGISPQGSVENNYNLLYADVKKWCAEEGYCDYILPQVYFGFENASLPYGDTIALWSSMTTCSKVKLVIGLAGYKVGVEDTYAGSSGKNEWINNSDILARQMKLAAALSNYGGVAIFRYDSVFAPASAVAEQVALEIENIKKND